MRGGRGGAGESMKLDAICARLSRALLIVSVVLSGASCRGAKPQSLAMTAKDFEATILTDGCKQNAATAIADGLLKGFTQKNYICGEVLHHEIVVDGDRILKYTTFLDLAMLKDPKVIAAQSDRMLRFQSFGALYSAAHNTPKDSLLDALKQKGMEAMDIPLQKWESALKLNIPTTNILDGHAYSLEIRDPYARFSVAPEKTYLEEKSLRMREGGGGQSDERDAVSMRPLGMPVAEYVRRFLSGKVPASEKPDGNFPGITVGTYNESAGASRVILTRGQKLYEVRYAGPRKVLAGMPWAFLQSIFAQFYATASGGDADRIMSQTVMGAAANSMEGRPVERATGPWVPVSFEWSQQCQKIVDAGKKDAVVKHLGGYAYSCGVEGAEVVMRVLSDEKFSRK